MYKELLDLLDTLSSVGLEYLRITPNEDGTSRISAANKEKTIAWDTIPYVWSEQTIAISGIDTLRSRMGLFDQNKEVQVELTENEYVRSMLFKQGRRKVSFRCSKPEILSVMGFFDDELINEAQYVKFNKDSFQVVSSAIASMVKGIQTLDKPNSHIALASEEGNLMVKVWDGSNDAFTDVFDGSGCDDDVKSHYDITGFKKVLTEAMRGQETCEFGIMEGGGGVTRVGGYRIMIPPVS